MSDVLFMATKVLQEAIYPFNIALLAAIAAYVFLRLNRLRAAQRSLAFSLAVLIVCSMGYTRYGLLSSLENQNETRTASAQPTADAIVVLGGTTAPLEPPRVEAEETHGARLLGAARLFHAGRAPKVCITGGPYRLADGGVRTESDDMRDVLVAYGVPDSAIVVEARSRNTFENALHVAEILGPGKKILLVTSAAHLPRATALFRKQGMEVVPVPCSHMAGRAPALLQGVKPDPGNLAQTEAAIKEYVGFWAYRLMGKL